MRLLEDLGFRETTLRMKNYFVVSVLLMLGHKVECWFTDEWMDSPFFQALISSAHWAGMAKEDILGEAIFLTFCVWLFIGLVMGRMVMQGGGWVLGALGIWGLTYILEWHHVVRTILSGEYYTGLYTSVIYLAFGVMYWRELLSHARWMPDRRSAT